VGEIMNAFVSFLHRYLAPFLAGICAAGASVASSGAVMAVLALAAAALLGISLPAGGRAIRRMVGVEI